MLEDKDTLWAKFSIIFAFLMYIIMINYVICNGHQKFERHAFIELQVGCSCHVNKADALFLLTYMYILIMLVNVPFIAEFSNYNFNLNAKLKHF